MLLETYLSCLKLEKLLQENMGYLIHLFFFRRASKYPLFSISQTVVHFFPILSLFMNNFCIAHASFSAIETFQKRHLQELGAFILSNLFFVSIPSIGVEHFWVDGKHVLHTPSVGVADICGVYVILILRA